jgi:phage gp16-like protein
MVRKRVGRKESNAEKEEGYYESGNSSARHEGWRAHAQGGDIYNGAIHHKIYRKRKTGKNKGKTGVG